MSRCFPFPPPGYEKKAKTDDTHILTKEKHKEKNHKKDKKDKEKRESKKRNDKERSVEKHRKKKDQKEKHKIKKDRDRDKEKDRTLDEKRIEGQTVCYNGEKLGPNSLQSVESLETKDSKFLLELGRRIADQDGAGNQMVPKITVTDQRRTELPGRVAESNIGNRAKGKEKTKDKKENGTKANGQRNKVEAKGLENAIVQSFIGMDQRRVEGMARPMEKDIEKQVEGKEKTGHKESDIRGDKHKDRDQEKKSKSKDKDRDKEKEKEKKAKEKREKKKEQAKLQEGGKESIDAQNIKPSHPLKENSKSSASEGNLSKRKELEINGYLHDNDIRPNKLPRPVSSSHPVLENGRKLEPCQTAIQFASERQGAADNCKVATKEHKINGLIQAQLPNVCSTRPFSPTVQANENGQASAKPPHPSSKPPHPDSKYLSQILSVPKMEEWSDFDEQEWLFSGNDLQSMKPIVGCSGDQGTRQVWAEALRIETADISALPYVIPY